MDLSPFASADLYRRNAFRSNHLDADIEGREYAAPEPRDPVRRLVDGWFRPWPEGASTVHDRAVGLHREALEGAHGDDRIESAWGEAYEAWDAVLADEACWRWAAEHLTGAADGTRSLAEAFRVALPLLLNEIHADLVFAGFREDEPRALLQYDALRRRGPEEAERALLAAAKRRLAEASSGASLARAIHWLDRAEDLPLSTAALLAVEADGRSRLAELVTAACADAERRSAKAPETGLAVYRALAETAFDPMRRIEKHCPEQARSTTVAFTRSAIAILTGHAYAVGDPAAARRELEALRDTFGDGEIRDEIQEIVASLSTAPPKRRSGKGLRRGRVTRADALGGDEGLPGGLGAERGYAVRRTPPASGRSGRSARSGKDRATRADALGQDEGLPGGLGADHGHTNRGTPTSDRSGKGTRRGKDRDRSIRADALPLDEEPPLGLGEDLGGAVRGTPPAIQSHGKDRAADASSPLLGPDEDPRDDLGQDRAPRASIRPGRIAFRGKDRRRGPHLDSLPESALDDGPPLDLLKDRSCAVCARHASGRRAVPVARSKGPDKVEEDTVEVPVCLRCAAGPLHTRRYDVAVVVLGGLAVLLAAYVSAAAALAFAQAWGWFAGLAVLIAFALTGRALRLRRLSRLARSPYLTAPLAQGWQIAP